MNYLIKRRPWQEWFHTQKDSPGKGAKWGYLMPAASWHKDQKDGPTAEVPARRRCVLWGRDPRWLGTTLQTVQQGALLPSCRRG